MLRKLGTKSNSFQLKGPKPLLLEQWCCCSFQLECVERSPCGWGSTCSIVCAFLWSSHAPMNSEAGVSFGKKKFANIWLCVIYYGVQFTLDPCPSAVGVIRCRQVLQKIVGYWAYFRNHLDTKQFSYSKSNNITFKEKCWVHSIVYHFHMTFKLAIVDWYLIVCDWSELLACQNDF